MYTYVCVEVRKYVHTFKINKSIYIYINEHTYTHTYIYTNIYIAKYTKNSHHATNTVWNVRLRVEIRSTGFGALEISLGVSRFVILGRRFGA